MRFNTIRDFIKLTPQCPFCKEPLSLEIFGSNLNGDLIVPLIPWSIKKYITGYGTTINDGIKKTICSSELTDKYISFYIGFSGCETNNLAFRIELDTNQVHGATENVQRLIWHYALCFNKLCVNKECNENNFFQYQSSSFLLERNFNRICPFFLTAELLCVTINDTKYCLITPYEVENSYIIDSKDIIATLPRINLHSLNDGDVIINKIKTMILFS